MAKIRIGDFGNAIAPVTRGPGAPRTPGAVSVPREAFVISSDAAQQLQRVSTGMLAEERAREEQDRRETEQRELQFSLQQQRERFAEEQQAQRNRAAASFASYEADITAVTADLSTRLTEGQIKREDAQAQLDKELEGLKKKHLEDLSPQMRAQLSDNLIRFDSRAKLQFDGVLKTHARQERADQANAALEALSRLPDPEQAVAQASALKGELTALYGAERAGKMVQSFAEGKWASHFTGRLNASRNDGRVLAALEQEVVKTSALDEDKKNVLLGRITGFREAIAARAERAAASRERTLRAQIETNDRLILQGFEPSAEQLSGTLAAAKGTPYEATARQQVAFANQTAQFREATPREQEAFLNQMEARVRANPTPDAVQSLNAYRTIANNTREQVREDPISFAAQKRLAEVRPLDFAKPETLGDQMNARISVARGMQQQYGAPLKVLTKQEAAQMSQLISSADSAARVRFFGTLKGAIPDAEAYQATMQQIAPDSPVTAWAGSLAGKRPFVERNWIRADVETQATKVSELMLRGESLLNPNAADRKQDGRGAAFKLPSEGDLRTAFDGRLGQAYASRPDAAAVGYQAAKAVYAALSADEGDYSGQINSGRWQRAMDMATGGTARWNGKDVIRPYGVGESEFVDMVGRRIGELSAAGKVKLSQAELGRMQLESAGDAKYLLRHGTGYLTDATGRPVVIDLTSSTVADEAKRFRDKSGALVSTQVPK